MKKILFNDRYGLTRAVLERRKTQTRRVITYPKAFHGKVVCGYHVCRRATDKAITEVCMYDENESPIDEGQILPKYNVGEIVSIAQRYSEIGIEPFPFCENGWNNKMFVKPGLMPHQIRITDVRVERLQDISDECCLKEGVVKWDAGQKDIPFFSYPNSAKCDYDTPQEAFAHLINKVSRKDVWSENPYVFVYDFELVK